MLQELKSIQVDGAPLDHVLALRMFAKQLRAEFDAANIEAPVWLDDKIRLLNRYIEMSRRDALEKRLTLARAERDRLATPEERRKRAEADIEALEKELAGK